MLEQLLEIVRQGGVQTTEGLAQRLGVTPGLIDMMLEDLERRGVVAQAGACGDGCAGCDLAKGCSQQGGQRLWTVRM
jgi:predicted ArsR family transcriptional regulator